MRSYIAFPVLILAALASAKDKPDWKTAKVLDAAASKLVAGEARPGLIGATMGPPTINDKQLTLLGDGFSYVIEDSRTEGSTSLGGLAARSIANKHHGCRFIVGSDVKYWQEKSTLHVIDADGKECKVEVLRQEQLHQPERKEVLK
jgi:hypothetical protein